MATDVEARAIKRLEAEAARRALKHPIRCPKCFSEIGDQCRTIEGVKTAKHVLRVHPQLDSLNRPKK